VRAASSEHENQVWTKIARLMYLVCVRLLELNVSIAVACKQRSDLRRSRRHATRASANKRREKLSPHWPSSVKQQCAKE
jgi:hypothetical protein